MRTMPGAWTQLLTEMEGAWAVTPRERSKIQTHLGNLEMVGRPVPPTHF